ncbi:hypothetical protein [Fibrella forsythiae]|uniref:Uncharacterized protein n=1 Tax=Fibrella forsythiae TaxID=2817061 RepID=A0ABS3JRC8_9BACT|nr:hypothetical protein [Fibrella forsythiae]MBO0952556.1 hypothetical protein [Fibrella forsythiae]
MKRLLSITFLTLLFCHALATVWVSVGVWWQEQHDLTQSLRVYSSVDSIVEFQVVLGKGQIEELAKRASQEEFAYHGKVYDVVSVEFRGDTLYIAGLEDRGAGLWHQDLLSFIKQTLSRHTPNDTQKKAEMLLKLLLKEYHLTSRFTLTPHLLTWLVVVRIADAPAGLFTRALAVIAPPPRG